MIVEEEIEITVRNLLMFVSFGDPGSEFLQHLICFRHGEFPTSVFGLIMTSLIMTAKGVCCPTFFIYPINISTKCQRLTSEKPTCLKACKCTL